MKLKKYLVFLLIVSLLVSGLTIAKAASYSQDEMYSDAITRLESLGIMDYGSGMMTRGEFAKAVILASGLEDSAISMRGTTIFPDITPGNELSGYVNAVLKKGFMTGLLDGRFHAEGSINYAQACTILVKSLGYENADLVGLWPKNYMIKAAELGLSIGIDLSAVDSLPKWAAAVMIDRLLDTAVKGGDKAFGEVSGITSESYIYGLISKPVYSSAEIVADFDPDTERIGTIDLSGNPNIVRNGQLIDITDIEENEVVYEVTDIWGIKRYILVVDDRVQGRITSISPNTVGIEDKEYQFSKVNVEYAEYNVGDYVTAFLGYDGKVAGFFDINSQENGDYAFVVNYGADALDYTVKLLMVDGTVREYKADRNYSGYKGMLVRYEMIDDETVDLDDVDYDYPGQCEVEKDARLIDGDYVSHSVAIFNVMSGDVGEEADVKASIIRWSDMPGGILESGRVQHIERSGEFDDVNVILIEDAFSEGYKNAIVKDMTYKTVKEKQLDENGNQKKDPVTNQPLPDIEVIVPDKYTLLIDGKDYIYSSTEYLASVGDIVKVELSGSNVSAILDVKSPEEIDSTIDAMDSNRIKIEGKTYYMSDNMQVYTKNRLGRYSLSDITEIAAGRAYGRISVYLDKPESYGGKVDVILVEY